MAASKKKQEEDKEVPVDISWSKDKEVRKIVLPEQMAIPTAITWLNRKQQELEKQIETKTVFDCYPTDGAVAFYRALESVYGFTDPQRRKTWFGTFPPVFVDVKTGINSSVRVPVGEIKVPDVDGAFYSAWTVNKGRARFTMTYVGKKKHEADVNRIVSETKRLIEEESIYKGKAIRIEFPDPNNIRSFEDFEPEFMDTTDTDPSQLIFPDDVERKVQTSLFGPVRRTEFARKAGVPLKRGVLLAGPYGVGKTLTAAVLAKYCEDEDWAFLYLRKIVDLPMAIEFAKMYGPAVIFAEDIDEILGTNARTSEVNEILNTIDGVDSKRSEIMVVLTTNHVENINRAMLRPGRLDDVITVRPPDAEAAIRLVQQYGGDLIDPSDDFTEAGQLLDGMIPAVIREVVERAKLGAIAFEEELIINNESLTTAAATMRDQLELLEDRAPDNRSGNEKAAEALGDKVITGLSFLAGLPAFQKELEAQKPANGKASRKSAS